MPVSIFEFITPSLTDKSNALPEGQFEHTEVDMDAIKAPLSDDLLSRLKNTLNKDKKAHNIHCGLIEKPSRSEYDFTLTQRLRWASYSIQDVAHILYHYTHGKGKDLTKREIIRNYNRVGAGPFPSLDPSYIAEIEKQVNPILAAREKDKPLSEDLKSSGIFRWVKGVLVYI